MEPLRRKAEDRARRIAARLWLPGSARGDGRSSRAHRPPSHGCRQRNRLSRKRALVDVPLRGKTAPRQNSASPRRGTLRVFHAPGTRATRGPLERSRDALAALLGTSGRVLQRALSMRGREAGRLERLRKSSKAPAEPDVALRKSESSRRPQDPSGRSGQRRTCPAPSPRRARIPTTTEHRSSRRTPTS